MKFQDGHSKKGGRKKGTPNKTTADIRARLLLFVDNSFEQIQTDMANLQPNQRIDTFFRLLEYALPKQKDVSIDLSSLSESEIEQIIETIISKQND